MPSIKNYFRKFPESSIEPLVAKDLNFMRLALRLARRGYGTTSPNPTVGAVLVKGGEILVSERLRRVCEPWRTVCHSIERISL